MRAGAVALLAGVMVVGVGCSDSEQAAADAAAEQKREAAMSELSKKGYHSVEPVMVPQAAASGNAEVLRLLLDAGMPVDFTNEKSKGQTALFSVVQGIGIMNDPDRKNGYVECAKLLLEAGANVNKKADSGRTPLAEVMFYLEDPETASIRRQLLEVAQLYVEAGADVNVRNYEGGSFLLFAAVENDDKALLKILLSSPKVDVNVKDEYGDTALRFAMENDLTGCAALLRKAGAK